MATLWATKAIPQMPAVIKSNRKFLECFADIDVILLKEGCCTETVQQPFFIKVRRDPPFIFPACYKKRKISAGILIQAFMVFLQGF